MSGIDVRRKTQAPLVDRSAAALVAGQAVVTVADGDATYVPLAGKNGLVAGRIVGSTIAGAVPTSGTWSTGDTIVDTKYGVEYVCTAGGTPGTWVVQGSGRTVPNGYMEIAAGVALPAGTLTSTGLTVTATAGPLAFEIDAFCNDFLIGTSGAFGEMIVKDELGAIVCAAYHTGTAAGFGFCPRPGRIVSYALGTVKTFTVYGGTSTGTGTFGLGSNGAAGWLKVKYA